MKVIKTFKFSHKEIIFSYFHIKETTTMFANNKKDLTPVEEGAFNYGRRRTDMNQHSEQTNSRQHIQLNQVSQKTTSNLPEPTRSGFAKKSYRQVLVAKRLRSTASNK